MNNLGNTYKEEKLNFIKKVKVLSKILCVYFSFVLPYNSRVRKLVELNNACGLSICFKMYYLGNYFFSNCISPKEQKVVQNGTYNYPTMLLQLDFEPMADSTDIM